jgi:hypothetical protein
MRLGAVLNNHEIVAACDLVQPVHVNRMTVQVNWHYGLGCGSYQGLDQV